MYLTVKEAVQISCLPHQGEDGRTASDHVAEDVVVCWMQGLHTPREHSNMMSKVGGVGPQIAGKRGITS